MVPLLGPLNNRCRIIIGTQTGTIILTTTHMSCSDLLFCLQLMCSSGTSGSSRSASIHQLQLRAGVTPKVGHFISSLLVFENRTDAHEAKRNTSFLGECTATALSNGIVTGLAQN